MVLHARVPACSPVLIAALLLVGGCSDMLTNAPPVADSTMVSVFTEMQLARARNDLYAERPAPPPDSVLDHYDLDHAAYERALDYYADHPKTYAAVYDSVVDRLSRQRRSLHAPPR